MPAVQVIHISGQFLNQSKNESHQRCSADGFIANQPGQFLTT
jgi:hypothetical protein